MKPIQYLAILIFFLSCYCHFPSYGQSYEYAPKELLVKWTSSRGTSERSIVKMGIEVKTRKVYQALDIELWKLEGEEDIPSILERYKDHPAIEWMEPNYVYKSFETTPLDPMFSNQWALKNTGQIGGTPNADIKATAAWEIQKESRFIYRQSRERLLRR